MPSWFPLLNTGCNSWQLQMFPSRQISFSVLQSCVFSSCFRWRRPLHYGWWVVKMWENNLFPWVTLYLNDTGGDISMSWLFKIIITDDTVHLTHIWDLCPWMFSHITKICDNQQILWSNRREVHFLQHLSSRQRGMEIKRWHAYHNTRNRAVICQINAELHPHYCPSSI